MSFIVIVSILRPVAAMKLRTKILSGYFLIFSVTILAGAGLLYLKLKDGMRNAIESELSNSSAAIVEMVRTAVDVSIRNRLRAVAEKNREIVAGFHARQLAGELTPEQARTQAVEVLLSQRIGDTGYIYCLNSAGVVVVHPVTALLQQDVSAYEFVQLQKQRKEGYLEYYWKNPGEEIQRPKALYMSYFEPWDWIISASSYREEFQALVDVEDFRSGILTQRFGRQGYAFVLDSRGEIVVHPFLRGNAINLRGARGEPVIQDIISRKFGKLQYWWKNPGEEVAREKILYFTYLPEMDWIVGASGYLEDFYAPLRTLQIVVIFIVPLVLFLGLPFSLWVGHSISRPLGDLRAGFSKAAAGDFTPRIEARGSDEMVQLAGYFNGFMERMAEYSDSLRREIKERRQAEEGKARTTAHLQEVVDSMQSIIIGLDAEQRVTLWNRSAAEEFGASGEDVLGRDVQDICPHYEVFSGAVDTAMREGRPVIQDKIPGQRDGRTVYSVVEVYPLVVYGERGVVVRVAEVTDRVHMEDMMIQTEKMMSVGGLAAGMAHEVNNPLGGILQGVQNITRRLREDLPANRRAAEEVGISLESLRAYMDARDVTGILDGVRDCGQRAASIVSNMLDFSRRSESRRTMCDIVGLLEKAVELAKSDYDLKKLYDFKKITILRDYEPDVPPVHCSATEIEQVFLNLFRNSAQAMSGPEGGTVPVIKLGVRREAGWVRVEIADNGPGMDEQTRKRIFEPFFTTKEVGEGTGLGLSVSYFIITRNHGGTFAVDSQPGRGASFVIRLPL